MEYKKFKSEIKEVTEAGEGVIVFATMDVIDHDGDVTLPGAFGEQAAHMVPAHDWTAAPIGKAKIHEVGNEARAHIKLNRNTTLGKDWHEAILFDADAKNGPSLQEWSYGFNVLESREGEFNSGDGHPITVRFLEKLEVAEISPVLKGAGINTRTLAIKSKMEKGAPKNEPMTLEEMLDGLCSETEKALARLADVEEKRLLGDGRRDEMLTLARHFGDLKAALEAPMPEEMAARILASNCLLRLRMLDGKAVMA